MSSAAPSSALGVLQETCRAILAMHDDPAVDALAAQVVRRYATLGPDEKLVFFRYLRVVLTADRDEVDAAIGHYQQTRSEEALQRLRAVTRPARQRLFRAVNLAPGGTAMVLQMRADVMALDDPQLGPVATDLFEVLSSWFNRGFLHLESLSWNTPAGTLEKLIEYEAVHEIRGWDDLQRRLAADRRCLAFFHPALPGEPIIFVEVALTQGLASSIQAILETPPCPDDDLSGYDTAIFYSITNCQAGLRGVSFGASLIKLAMAQVGAELPQVEHFATLSPLPGFRAWAPDRPDDLAATAARYLAVERRDDGRPLDPVARFHLYNGARLERVVLDGDDSDKGIAESWGVLVNYRYSGEDLAANHEAYVNDGVIAMSDGVAAMIGNADLPPG